METSERSRNSEAFKPSVNHWTMRPGIFKERLTKAQLQHVLLNHPDPIVSGMGCEWKSKNLGAGIYELWVEEKK